MTGVTLSIDIGGTKIAAGVVRGRELLVHGSVPTPHRDGAEQILAAAWAVAESVLGYHVESGGERPVSLGVASAGVVDPTSGRVVSATDTLRDWAGADVGNHLARVSGMRVAVLNDAQAHAWGEYRHGAGRGGSSMILFGVGTGIGGGLIHDGQLVIGSHFVAGHLGHLPVPEARERECSCGATGHLEAVASGTGIEAAFSAATGSHLTGPEIAALAEHDEATSPAARDAITTAGLALGRVIAGLLNTLDPDRVVLAGSVTRAGANWWDAVHQGVCRDALPLVSHTPLVPGELHNAALIGAADWARHERNHG